MWIESLCPFVIHQQLPCGKVMQVMPLFVQLNHSSLSCTKTHLAFSLLWRQGQPVRAAEINPLHHATQRCELLWGCGGHTPELSTVQLLPLN